MTVVKCPRAQIVACLIAFETIALSVAFATAATTVDHGQGEQVTILTIESN